MAASSCTLRVQWSEQTLRAFKDLDVEIPWDDHKERIFSCEWGSVLTIEDVAAELEAMIESLFYEQVEDGDKLQVQVHTLRPAKASEDDDELPFGDYVSQHLAPGDKIIAEAQAISYNQGLRKLRNLMRFALNDRVVCYCGARWLSGQIVGTVVPDDGSLIPYLVKTDPIPGLPAKTISVPQDLDSLCTQEVCFDPDSELHLIKAAALVIPVSCRPRLRFKNEEQVVCRIRSNRDDSLEHWVPGRVCSTWPNLPGDKGWEIDGISGEYPDAVPYKVDLEDGTWIYCHRDHHTLIRRKGMEPKTLVRGISKRMEVRTALDGSKEKVDHATERCKRLAASELSDADCIT